MVGKFCFAQEKEREKQLKVKWSFGEISERKTPEVAHCVERLLPGINVAQERRNRKRKEGTRIVGDTSSRLAVGEFSAS